MKYIKLFETFDRWSRDQKAELQDYCETNLAYLIDEGFKIGIGQNISAHLIDNSGSQMKFNNNPSYHNVSIQITKKDSADTSDIDREDFLWEDVKDQFIPFVLRLEKEYDIEKIRFLGDDNYRFYDYPLIYMRHNFEFELDTLPIHKVSYIDIFLSGEKEKLNESLSPKEELEDFCDTHLAYLTDKNFEVEYTEQYGGHMTEVVIKTSGVTQIFTWDEVKDHFIPFLHMLSKEYNLFNFHFEDYDCKKNEFICFQTFMGSKHYYSEEDVISDNIDIEQFTKRYGLYSIKLKIGKKIS